MQRMLDQAVSTLSFASPNSDDHSPMAKDNVLPFEHRESA